jgi:hypothetical protein
MSSTSCPFESLSVVSTALENETEETKYAEWFVVSTCHGDDGVFARTNLEALASELNNSFGTIEAPAAVHLKCFSGGEMVAVDPDNDRALEAAEKHVKYMGQRQHLDWELYNRTMRERAGELWLEMSRCDRMQMLKNHGEPLYLALDDQVPAEVMETFRDILE